MNKSDKKTRQSVIIFIFGLLVIVVGITLQIQLKPSKNIDNKTLCPINMELQNQTVIIIDKSDKWEDKDIGRIENWLTEEYKTVPAQGRLTVMLIGGNGRASTEIKVLFDMCNPGTEEECNSLYQNCRQIRKRYEESFSTPLKQIIALLVKPSQSSYSPLFETIVQVIDDSKKSNNLEIHIVSDLMENGSKFRFYETIPLYKEIINEYKLSTKSQITIHAHVIERRKHPRELIDMVKKVWEQYFKHQGIVIDFERFLIAE